MTKENDIQMSKLSVIFIDCMCALVYPRKAPRTSGVDIC